MSTDTSDAVKSPTTKQAVVEQKQRRSRLNWIVASYWFVVLAGLPFWYYTTTTERLSLPSAQVKLWQAKQPCPIAFTVAGEDDNRSKERSATIVDSFVEECIFDKENRKLRNSGQISQNSDKRKGNPSVVKYSAKFKLVFSLFYEDASREDNLQETNLSGDIGREIIPLLNHLRTLHEFDIEVQTQYLAPLAIEIVSSEEGTLLYENHLQGFVNSAQWNLASAVTLDPVLHFIAYIPIMERRPMRIANVQSNSFILPQWGGIVILNPSDQQSLDNCIKNAFSTFRAQLARLLGLTLDFSIVGNRDSLDQRIERLIRARALESAREAVDTLAATIKLTQEIGNMRVNREVRNGVESALKALSQAQAAQTDLDKLKFATNASIEASKAFFHPSMLGLLYFPQEHKYAVYTPLLGPVAIPLFSYLFRELSRWRTDRRNLKIVKTVKSQ